MRAALLLSIALYGCAADGAVTNKDLSRQGDETFGSICAKCHGQEGTGGLPVTPGGPTPRDLTDPAWQASVSDAQLLATIKTGKPPIMPAFASVLTPMQLDAIVAKVRRLRKVAKQ